MASSTNDDLAGVHPSRRALLTGNSSAQQQQSNASSQPPAAGGLFGSSTQQSTQAGSLFGGAAAQQQQQQQQAGGGTGGGLFGSSTTQQPAAGATGGGLFGSSTAQQPQQQQQSGGLFGSSTTQQPQQQSGGLFGSSTTQQPQQQSGGLFGGSTTQQPQQQTGGLFGSTTTQQPQQQQSGGGLFGSVGQPAQQQQQSTSMFGATQNKPATNPFGASTSNQPAAGGSLFGGSSLFGNNTQQQQQQANMNQPQQQTPSFFGLSAQAPPAPTSMLNASQYRANQYQPFAGKLSMGQTATAQPAAQGAVKIGFEEMRPTTRYADCIDKLKDEFEAVDKMIQNQERFCREIEAFLPKHGQNVTSLAPDVEFVKEKAEAAESALAMDATGVVAQRRVLEGDQRDFQRLQRVILNSGYASQYRYTGFGSAQTHSGIDGEMAKDMDLVNNYFQPVAADLKKTLDSYAANLSEIEGHMRVIEQSALAQAQQLAAKRAGVGGGGPASGEETVRELADTLRGFEASILGAADLVGQCREGVNGLVLAKFGEGMGRR